MNNLGSYKEMNENKINPKVPSTCNELGATWYMGSSESQPMLTCMAKAEELKHNFIVAYDYVGDGDDPFMTKTYASYKSSKNFIKEIEDIEPSERCFYVIIPGDKPCCLFADLEWSLDWKSEKEIVDKFSDLVINTLKIAGVEITRDDMLYATASLAETNKGSLHFHVPSVYFDDVKDHQRFMNGIKLKLDSDGDDWAFIDSTDKSYILKTFIDFGVYNRNRQFRLPYSSKRKKRGDIETGITCVGERPLIPYDEVNFHFSDWTITDVNMESNNVDVTAFPAEITCNKRQSWSKALVQGILDNQNLDVSVNTFKGSGLITLKNKTGSRKCPIGGEINESDNSYITIRDNCLHYHCHDEQCKGRSKVIYTFNNDNDELKHPEPPFKKYFWEFNKNRNKYIDDIQTPNGSKQVLNDEFKKLKRAFVDEINQYCCIITGSTKVYVLYRTVEKITNPYNSVYLGEQQEVVKYTDKIFSAFREGFDNFDIFFNGACVLGVSIWLKHPLRKQKKRETCRPYAETHHQPPDIFNMFKGFAITKETALISGNKDPSLILKFIKNAWCQNDLPVYNWILDWMAHLLQKPWIKMGTSIVLRGNQGIGKGLIVQILGKIIGGSHFFQPTSQDDMFGSFNYLLDNRFLCFADEMFWGGDKKKAGQLKKLLTENTRTSNVKYGALRRLDNMINWMFASNEDWVIPAGIRARRFTVLNVSDELYSWSDDDKKALVHFSPFTFANFLYNRDISGFNSFQHINTEGLTEQKILSMSTVHSWFVEQIEKREFDFDKFISKNNFHLSFLNTATGNYKPSFKAFWMELNKFHTWVSKRIMVETQFSGNKKKQTCFYMPPRLSVVNMVNKLYNCDIIKPDEEDEEDDKAYKLWEVGNQPLCGEEIV